MLSLFKKEHRLRGHIFSRRFILCISHEKRKNRKKPGLFGLKNDSLKDLH